MQNRSFLETARTVATNGPYSNHPGAGNARMSPGPRNGSGDSRASAPPPGHAPLLSTAGEAPPAQPAPGNLTPPAAAFLEKLLGLHLLELTPLEGFLEQRADRLGEYACEESIGTALVQAGLLTQYQLDRILAGSTHGLVLGSYRVVETLGSGGMGVVFTAEHRLMQRRVAVKVLPVDDDCHPAVRQRFYAEMRVLAELCHENVVLALDAGEVQAPGPGLPELVYLAMELVEGGDLEQYVAGNGPLPVIQACDFIRQAACGLRAAHDRHLIHRDIKPSNILLTRGGQVKLVDFGLARQFCSRLTDPRALLGSVEFMAPEQSHDPSAVGKEADIYGLGATLFWLLTGEAPYPFSRHVGQALRLLQQERPRRVRALRPEVPEDLGALVDSMLDRNPARRPTSALAVMNALAPFLIQEAPALLAGREAPAPPPAAVTGAHASPRPGGGVTGPRRRALIVDDESSVRTLNRVILGPAGFDCVEVSDGGAALDAAAIQRFDLVLLDLGLPDIDGYEVCRRLREGNNPHLKVIVVSGSGDQDALSESLPRGADDYITKPFQPRQMLAKVQHAMRLKDAQERARILADQLALTNRQLEHSLEARALDVRQAHDALLFAMAKMAESRDGETPGHLRRLQCYVRVLAQEVSSDPYWVATVDDRFLEQMERCVPLHDIGKLGLPDEVLLKPAALNAAERALVETHPLIGDRILEALGREHGTALSFMGMARAIVRHHHERFDGRGYPDRLGGDAIPAAARLTAVADVYDALRRERLHKPSLPHAEAVRIILERSPGQFDPALLTALSACHGQLERIYRDVCE